MRFQLRLSTIFVLMLVIVAFFGGIAVQRIETERILGEMQSERDRALAEREDALVLEAQNRRLIEELQRQRSNADVAKHE